MTFLDKAKEKYKKRKIEVDDTVIIKGSCPFDYNLENVDECDKVGETKCYECWNREMPDTEPLTEKEKMIDAMSENAYNKGLNDAWELAKKIAYINSTSERNKIFGYETLSMIVDKYTPQEAIAKLKEYEDAQKIEVGDVVFCWALTEFDDRENKENYGVVTGIYNDHYEILMKNGDTTGFKLKECEKTGKHIDIKAILEQIGK